MLHFFCAQYLRQQRFNNDILLHDRKRLPILGIKPRTILNKIWDCLKGLKVMCHLPVSLIKLDWKISTKE